MGRARFFPIPHARAPPRMRLAGLSRGTLRSTTDKPLALVPVAITARLHLLPGNVVIEQMLRYSLVAIVYPPMYASSFWTRYRNGLGPPFFSLTKPQIVSIELPSAFFLAARFISSNSTELGSFIFAAIVAFAFFITDSSSS